MGLRDFYRREEPATTPDRAGIVTRYKHLRAVGQTLNQKLVQRLSRDILHEGGRKLGLLKRDILVFDSEDEAAILMDYCIYDVRRKERNAFEQYLLDSAPAPESDEMVCLLLLLCRIGILPVFSFRELLVCEHGFADMHPSVIVHVGPDDFVA